MINILFVIIQSLSVSSTQTVSLVGTWRCDLATMLIAMTPEEREKYGALPSNVKNNVQQNFLFREYRFTADHRVDISLPASRTEHGAWKMVDDELVITLRESETKFRVEVMNEKIHLHMIVPASGGLFSTLVLMK